MMSRFMILAFVILVPAIYAEKLQAVISCQRSRAGAANYGTATISEIRITPCPEADSRRPCILRKGTNVTIEVDLVPTVASSTPITGKAFWANRMMELPLPNMNTNACESLACPIQANVPQTYRYILPVSRSFPTRRYDVRWKLTGAPFNVCFQFPIQILA